MRPAERRRQVLSVGPGVRCVRTRMLSGAGDPLKDQLLADAESPLSFTFGG